MFVKKMFSSLLKPQTPHKYDSSDLYFKDNIVLVPSFLFVRSLGKNREQWITFTRPTKI